MRLGTTESRHCGAVAMKILRRLLLSVVRAVSVNASKLANALESSLVSPAVHFSELEVAAPPLQSELPDADAGLVQDSIDATAGGKAAEAYAASQSLRQLIKSVGGELLAGEALERETVDLQLPFSRADGASYFRLVEIWNSQDVDWTADDESRACPACSSTSHRFLFLSYDHYPFHACNSCSTWFVPYRKLQERIDAFFANVPEARRIADEMMANREKGTRAADRERFIEYFQLIEPASRIQQDPRRYLDVGCGVGHSVELAQELGMEAVGVEVSQVAIDTARANGRNVISATQWSDDIPYQVVSLFETLEHVTSPDDVLRKVAAALSPDGVVIITVPNRASWEFSILRERCFHIYGGVDGVGHINLFDRDGLQALLQRHGMSIAYSDSQYSNNVFEIASALFEPNRSWLDFAARSKLSIQFPTSVHRILNSIGPAWAALDRAACRTPILIAIACHSSAQEALEPVFEQMRRTRDEQIYAAFERA
jgi:2-polyprenyl-3-methyl-5-hydroxy-6-metoxy-1,4-benzoquinol methylase